VPPDKESRRLGQPAAPQTTPVKGTTRIADHRDSVGSDVGALLTTWVGIKLEVDQLVDDARSRVAAIPDMRTLAGIVGEQLILLRALELEVAQLRDPVGRLRQRGRVA
jgi:hypothetical protein